jgi:hypothetical protein
VNKKLKSALFWFILIQPFLDIYWLYKPPLDTLFKFSIPTILRIVGILVLVCLYFSQKRSWQLLREQWWLIAYLVVLALYSVAHLWSVAHFKGLDPTSYGYSTASELFYLIRMAIPITILYITRYSDFDSRWFQWAIQGTSALYSFTIVLTNLFTISLTSYHSFAAKRIHANIFAWFGNHHYPFYQLASKGFFFKANTTSAILFMLLPLMLYFMQKKLDWINVLLVAVQALAMLMLGTKVGVFGLVVDLLVFLVAYLVHGLGLKNVKLKKGVFITLLCLGLGAGAIIPHTPTLQRNTFETSVAENRSKRGGQKHLNSKLKQGLKKYSGKKEAAFLKKFIRKHYRVYSLKSGFVFKSYSYKYDPYFWLRVMKMPASERMNYRHMEILMLNQVRANNHNSLDKWLGISYIRENNIFPLERDFLAQAYSLGIIGMILFLGWYVWALIYALWAWFKYKACRQFKNSNLLIASGFILATAFYSGNVLDYLTASILIGFIMGYMLNLISKQKRKSSTSLSFN